MNIHSLCRNRNVLFKLLVLALPFKVAVTDLRCQKPIRSGPSLIQLALVRMEDPGALSDQRIDVYVSADHISFYCSLSIKTDEVFCYLHGIVAHYFCFPRIFILQAVSKVIYRPPGVAKTLYCLSQRLRNTQPLVIWFLLLEEFLYCVYCDGFVVADPVASVVSWLLFNRLMLSNLGVFSVQA